MKINEEDYRLRQKLREFFETHMMARSTFARQYCPGAQQRINCLSNDSWPLSASFKACLADALRSMKQSIIHELYCFQYHYNLDHERLLDSCCFTRNRLRSEMGMYRDQKMEFRSQKRFRFLVEEIMWIIEDIDSLVQQLEN